MDIKFFLKVYMVLIFINEAITGLQLNVTKEQCGLMVDLAVEQSLVLDYDGADLNQTFGEQCVITVYNSDYDKMICVKTEPTFNVACSLIFNYHISDFPSSFFGNGHTCYDFYREPLCDRRTPVYATFQSSLSFATAHVQVEIYVTPVTTTQLVETTTWSYEDTDTEFRSPGLVIGLVVGAAVLLLSFAACAYMRRKNIFDSNTGQPKVEFTAFCGQHQQQFLYNDYELNGYREYRCFNVQYGNQYSNQQFVSSVPQQYIQSTSPSQESDTHNSTNLAGYHVHPTVNLTIRDQQGSTQQSGPNKTLSQSDPSAPPPPYPGY